MGKLRENSRQLRKATSGARQIYSGRRSPWASTIIPVFTRSSSRFLPRSSTTRRVRHKPCTGGTGSRYSEQPNSRRLRSISCRNSPRPAPHLDQPTSDGAVLAQLQTPLRVDNRCDDTAINIGSQAVIQAQLFLAIMASRLDGSEAEKAITYTYGFLQLERLAICQKNPGHRRFNGFHAVGQFRENDRLPQERHRGLKSDIEGGRCAAGILLSRAAENHRAGSV